MEKGLYRRIANWHKSKKEREIFERNDRREERGKNIDLSLVGDYEIDGNLGLRGANRRIMLLVCIS